MLQTHAMALDLEPAPLALDHELGLAFSSALIILGSAEIIPARIFVALKVKPILVSADCKMFGAGPLILQ